MIKTQKNENLSKKENDNGTSISIQNFTQNKSTITELLNQVNKCYEQGEKIEFLSTSLKLLNLMHTTFKKDFKENNSCGEMSPLLNLNADGIANAICPIRTFLLILGESKNEPPKDENENS